VAYVANLGIRARKVNPVTAARLHRARSAVHGGIEFITDRVIIAAHGAALLVLVPVPILVPVLVLVLVISVVVAGVHGS
jgi:hypothetical protein